MPHRCTTSRATAAARTAAPTADVLLRAALFLTASLLLLGATRASAAPPHRDPAAAAPSAPPVPSPYLTPDDVVTTVLEALAQNDTPVKDRGISVTFAFSSPANRAFVGPLESFADLVRDDAYRPLLYHRHATRGSAHVTGDRATERVIITTTSGFRVAYVFSLSLQTDGPYKGCWMTDGVTREPPSPLSGMRVASLSGRQAIAGND